MEITTSSAPAGWSISRKQLPANCHKTETQTEVDIMTHNKTTMAIVLAFTLGLSSLALAQQAPATAANCDTKCDTKCDTANADGCDSAKCNDCAPLRPRIQCGKCNGTCYLKVEKGTKEKTCFKVEAKQICIPRVRFPWQAKDECDGCDSDGTSNARCGRVKTVLVLKKHKYECPDCKYTWEISGAACDAANCDTNATATSTAKAQLPAGKRVLPPQPAVATQGKVSSKIATPKIITADQWQKQTPAKTVSTDK